MTARILQLLQRELVIDQITQEKSMYGRLSQENPSPFRDFAAGLIGSVVRRAVALGRLFRNVPQLELQLRTRFVAWLRREYVVYLGRVC